jgi:putative FmdB family regulatory protein
MPVYLHGCQKCSYEWDDLFKLNDPVPEQCPKCKKKKCIKRLISETFGTVVLTGREHVQKLWTEGKKIARDAKKSKSENTIANLTGENNYHQQKLREDKFKKEKL